MQEYDQTHEYKDPLSILLPSFGLFLVVYIRHLRIHGEERTRAINEVGLLQSPIFG
jgi:hypothetical protein